MPSASFYANFDAFDKAVSAAGETLKEFELSTRNVQGQLTRLSKAFDGSTLIREGRLLAEVFQKNADVSKYTEAELRKMNATLEAAADKARRVGQEMPEAFRRSHEQVRAAVGEWDKYRKALAENEAAEKRAREEADTHTLSVGKLVGSYVTGQAVFEVAKTAVLAVAGAMREAFVSTLDLADTVSNLAAKTDMSVEGLQRLSFAGTAAGVDINTLADAAAEMGRRLADGDKSAVGALKALGFTVQQFKALDPDEQILAVNEALQKFGSTAERNAIQADLFGKAWKTIAPAMAEDLRALGEQADALGIVLDRQTIAQIDRFGDRLGALEKVREGLTARFFTPLFEQLDRLSEKLDQVHLPLGDVAESFGRLAIVMAAQGGNPASALTNWFWAWDETKAAKIARSAREWVEIGDKLKSTMHSTAGATREDTEETDKNTEAKRRARAEAEKLAKAMDDLTGRAKVAAMEAMALAIEKAGGLSKVLASEYAKVNKVFGDGIVAATHLGETLPDAFIDIARATQAWNTELGTAADLLKQIQASQIQGSERWQPPVPGITMPGVTTGIDPTRVFGWGSVIDLGPVPAPNQAFLDQAAAIWGQFTHGISTSLSDMLVGLRSWKDGLKDLWRDALTAVSDIISAGLGKIINSLGQKLFQALGPQGIAAIGAGVGSFMVGKSQGAGWGVLSGAGSGAAIGSMFGPMGTAIGAAAGALAGLLGGLIGPSKGAIAGREADARIGQTQAQLLQQFGSVQAIAGMGPAGAELAAAWNSRNVAGEQQFQAKVNEFLAQQERVTALLGEQARLEGDLAALEKERAKLAESLVVSYADVQRIGQTYKLDLEGLGVAIGQMGTTASFTTIINDLDTLARAARQAGGELDWGGALYGMREEIGALVASALRMGTDVPANMRTFIEELYRSGNLIDENGRKIEDISQLKFGAPIETEAEKTTQAMGEINKAIGELKSALLEVVDALKVLLPQAARAGADQVNTTISGLRPTIRIGVEVDDVEVSDGVPRLGTGGVVRRPTLAVIGEAGPEAVVPLSGHALSQVVPAASRMVGELRWRGRSIADVFWAEARPSAVARGLV